MLVSFESEHKPQTRTVGKLLAFHGGGRADPLAICVDAEGLFHSSALHSLRLVDFEDGELGIKATQAETEGSK